ncbi:MAG: hypothetical protein KF744_00315 [Taibaiella sp.]|nr:hypothetical protein [Taibaiella sp.]
MNTTNAVKISAKVISSLIAGFILFMFAGDIVYSIQHPGTTHIQPLSTTSGRRDVLMLSIMALIVTGMLLVWWKEKAGAWISIISVTAIIACVWLLNHVPLSRLAGFFLAIVPAVVLLLMPRQRKLQDTSL